MADARALVTALIALINDIITTYIELQGTFSENILSDRIIHWRNWKKGERVDRYEHHAMTKQQ